LVNNCFIIPEYLDGMMEEISDMV